MPSDYSEARLLGRRAPGPYLRPQGGARRGATKDVPLVGAFYWYHFAERDGRLLAGGGKYEEPFAQHPATVKGVDFRSEDWHYGQLRDMGHAGLNLVLPMYWGNPADAARPEGALRWSFEGVPPMVRALDKLGRQGAAAPKIGLYYDTTTLTGNAAAHTADLTTPNGRAWFYVSVRDFFSMVPPHLRATVGGRPLVVISPANHDVVPGAGDPRVLAYLRERFAADFGVEPYVVAHAAWDFPNADATLHGGGAHLSLLGEAAMFSPGLDTPPPGRDPGGIFLAPENGALYRRQWERLLAADPARRPRLAFIESWNQWATASAIADSKEWGRRLLKATAPYAAMWKAGKRLTLPPLAGAVTQVSVRFDPEASSHGIALVPPVGDGRWKADAAGSGCVSTVPGVKLGTAEHLYFRVDDRFAYDLPDRAECELMVEYLDEGGTPFVVEYDASAGPGPVGAAYRVAGTVYRGGTGAWRTAVLRLKDARLAGRQNQDADFRFAVSKAGPSLKVRWVTLRRLDGAAAPGRPTASRGATTGRGN